jgi:hypothetical protein
LEVKNNIFYINIINIIIGTVDIDNTLKKVERILLRYYNSHPTSIDVWNMKIVLDDVKFKLIFFNIKGLRKCYKSTNCKK